MAGLTAADDRAEAGAALAAVMEVHGVPKVVLGSAAVFPGEAGVDSVEQCRVCKKPETANNTIVCDVCRQSYHLSCVMLKPKQAVEKANEHWQCEFCGPEHKRQCWTLGKLASQSDRTYADSKVYGSESHLEHGVVSSSDTDVAVESNGNGTCVLRIPAKKTESDSVKGGDVHLSRVTTKDMEPATALSKENLMPVKRGRGRPRKESKVLKDQILSNVAVDLGTRDNGCSDQQPTLNLG